ncbi:urease accessory protein UreF [Priestia megaterium]|nr:urease accessory protein UreF [Priestia megaterium]
MTNHFLSLIQLCDSNFPSGAFSHSFGMETYIQNEKITNAKTFADALYTYLTTQLTYTDGLACKLAYEFIAQNDVHQLMNLDHELYALALAKETREGTRRIGQRMAKLCLQLFPVSSLIQYEQLIKHKECFGHPSIVFALVGYHLKVPKKTVISTHLYAAVSSLVQNAVRGIPIGQTDGQKTLLMFQPYLEEATEKIIKASADELGAMTPGLEIAQMQHERLHVRLFMS